MGRADRDVDGGGKFSQGQGIGRVNYRPSIDAQRRKFD
jgi:hypothetical protein